MRGLVTGPIGRHGADPTAVLEYVDDSVLTVDNSESYEAAAIAGLAIVRVPRPRPPDPRTDSWRSFPFAQRDPCPSRCRHGRDVSRQGRAAMNGDLEWLGAHGMAR